MTNIEDRKRFQGKMRDKSRAQNFITTKMNGVDRKSIGAFTEFAYTLGLGTDEVYKMLRAEFGGEALSEVSIFEEKYFESIYIDFDRDDSMPKFGSAKSHHDIEDLEESDSDLQLSANFFKPEAPRGWIVKDFIPDKKVTILSGDGGTGKSTLAAQLALCVANRKPWLGMETDSKSARVLYVCAEDPPSDLRDALVGTTRTDDFFFDGLTLATSKSIVLLDWSQRTSFLFTQGERGMLEATELWGTLKARVEFDRYDLVILDSLVDLFAGNENDRMQAKQFVAHLMTLNCAVILLTHTSLRGTATGTSGSTGWRNAARSLITVKRTGRTHTLESFKNQFGPRPASIKMEWCNGIYVPVGRDAPPDDAPEAPPAVDVPEACRVEFLDRLKAAKVPLSDRRKANNYAPRVFATSESKFNRDDFAAAMATLIEAGRIVVRDYTDNKRNKRQRLEMVAH